MAERSVGPGPPVHDRKSVFQLAKILVQLFDREEVLCSSRSPDSLHRYPRPHFDAVRSRYVDGTVSIEENHIAREYQSVCKRNLSLRDYGSTQRTLAKDLPIFIRQSGQGKWWLSLSKPKFLEFLLVPVLTKLQGEGGIITETRLAQCLKEVTGFTIGELYKVCSIHTFRELSELIHQQTESFNLREGGSVSFAYSSEDSHTPAVSAPHTQVFESRAPLLQSPFGSVLGIIPLDGAYPTYTTIPNVGVDQPHLPSLLPTPFGAGCPGGPTMLHSGVSPSAVPSTVGYRPSHPTEAAAAAVMDSRTEKVAAKHTSTEVPPESLAIQLAEGNQNLFKLAKILVELFTRENVLCSSGRHPNPEAVRCVGGPDGTIACIKRSKVAGEYKRIFGKGSMLSYARYGCKQTTFAQQIPIFNQQDNFRKPWLTLSAPKLVQFLFTPVLSSQGGVVSESRLPECLVEFTGFTVDELYKACGVHDTSELMRYADQQTECFKLTKDGSLSFASPPAGKGPSASPSSRHEPNYLALPPEAHGPDRPFAPKPMPHEGDRPPGILSNPVGGGYPGRPVNPAMPSSVRSVFPRPTLDTSFISAARTSPSLHPAFPRPTLDANSIVASGARERSLHPVLSKPTLGLEVRPIAAAGTGELFSPTVERRFESFPNPEISAETFLPCHSLFRRDLPVPSVAQSRGVVQQIDSRTRRGGKEKMIERTSATLDQIIKDLSTQGKFVPSGTVKRLLDDMLASENRNRAYPDRIFPRDVSRWSDYEKAHGRIVELVKVFCWFSPITSLFELERAIVTSENVSNFEALQMGPLLKHPKVCDLFKPPTDLVTVPEVTMYQIHKHLTAFISRHPRGTKRLDLEEFLTFVAQKEGVESINNLCIRISSFPLAIQTNFKFRTSQTQIRMRNEEAMKVEMENILDHEVDKLKKQLSRSDDPLSVRRNLQKKEPVQILIEVFESFSKNFSGMQRNRVSDFLQCVTRDARMRRLFLLAIYEGAYGLPIDKLIAEDAPRKQTVCSDRLDFFNQPEGLVLAKVCEDLTCAPFPIDLASLARLEQNVVYHFSAPAFHSLGHLSFIQFLASHEEATKALGGSVIGGHSASSTQAHSIKDELLRFVSQLKPEYREKEEVVAVAIETQFGVDSVETLGCGSVKKLLTQLDQVSVLNGVSYLSPLIYNGGEVVTAEVQGDRTSGGILGFQGRDDALACLRKAPLLEDLGAWSHWDLVYKPMLGNLSDFLQKEAIKTAHSSEGEPVTALKLSPGTLVRICPNSSTSDFVKSLQSADHIATAGHLVSMVVKAGSVCDIPIQLLGSHIESALEEMSAEIQSGGSAYSDIGEYADDRHQDVASMFVFQCLIRIPMKICQYVANGVLIEPLRKVTSSSAVDGLLSYCRIPSERLFLQSLGMVIGIKAWCDDFKTMLSQDEESCYKHNKKLPSGSAPKTVLEHLPTRSLSNQFEAAPVLTSEQEVQPQVGGHAPQQEGPQAPFTKEEMVERETKCKAIVEAIRRDEFGEGIELDDKQQAVAARQRSREGRGLQRLSLELYSKDTHFVLELIQNADDNAYPDTVIPSLKFVINEDRISVLNNEVGFLEKHIRAICDVGQSTKGAHRSGYIGQKGIGFKSVFRITDTPEVHSSGFHIKFDKGSDPIGFILPHWVEVEDTDCESSADWRTRIVLPLKKDLQSSKMVRKFRDIQPSLLLFIHRLRNLTVEDEVSGEARRMERLDVGDGIVEIHHSDGQDRWLVIRKQLTEAQRYKNEVEATEIALAFPLPINFKALTLAKDLHPQQVFAFLPLRSYGFRFIVQGDFDLPSSREDVNSDSAWNQWLKEEIPFLFVDAMEKIKGLPTISEIQAVSLFLQFVPLEGEIHDFFKSTTSHILHLLRGRKCLPSDPNDPESEGETEDLLTLLSVPSEDQKSHQEKSCIWKQPSQLLSVKDDFIRKHIRQPLLERTLHLSFLNSSLLPALNTSLQGQLGVRSFNVQDLTAIAKAVLDMYHTRSAQGRPQDDSHSSSLENDLPSFCSDSDDSDFDPYTDDQAFALSRHTRPTHRSHAHQTLVKWISNWLACVQIVMKDTHADLSSETLKSLKGLQVIPLSNGSLASADSTSLFFPAESSSGSDDGSKFKDMFREMHVVDPVLFEVEDGLTRSQVQKVLEQLGVRSLYPVDIIKHHIIPKFKTWKGKTTPDLLSTYLVYIRDNIGQPGVIEAEMVQLLKDCVVVVTKQHGPKQPSRDVVHFSSVYKPAEEDDLESMFPAIKSEWSFVSPVYLKKSSLSKTTPAVLAHSWRSFLGKLGVKLEVAVQASNEHIQQGSPRWDELHEVLKRSPDGSYTVRDYLCQEFKDIVKSIKKLSLANKRKQMIMLAEYLDQHWDAKYRQYVTADYYDGENKHRLGSIPSSFKLSLVHLTWLPSKPADPSQAFSEKLLYQGRELFDDAPMLHNLLNLHVPYLGATIRNSNLVQELQIVSSVSATEMIEFLQKWSQISKQGTPFFASIDHMRKVYLYLKREWDQQQLEGATTGGSIKDSILSNALIFVPDQVPQRNSIRNVTSVVPGHFYSTHQVCWKDQSTVLYRKQCNNESLPVDLVPKLLEPHYSQEGQNEIRQAFLSQGPFGIDEEPKLASLIALLKYISSVSATPDEKSVSDFTSIVLRLAELCRDQELNRLFLYNNLKQAKVFPTQTDKWVALEDGIFENDYPELAKHFREVQKVYFLRWPKNSLHGLNQRRDVQSQEATREEFLHICKISRFSHVVRTEVAPEGMAKPVEDLLIRLHHYVPLVQRFLATQCMEHYQFLNQKNLMGDKLNSLKILSTEALYCRYSIVHNDCQIHAAAVPSSQGCELEVNENTVAIYILQDKVEKPRCLVPALTTLFQTETPEFERFLMTLLLENPSTDEDKTEIAAEHKLQPLPEGEPIWLVPVILRQPSQPEEVDDETSESDEVSSGKEEDDEVRVKVQEDGGLKSWPPRAAVNLDQAAYKGRQAKGSAWPPARPEDADRLAGVIGEEEIEQVKRRHVQGSFTEGRSTTPTLLSGQTSKPVASSTGRSVARSEEDREKQTPLHALQAHRDTDGTAPVTSSSIRTVDEGTAGKYPAHPKPTDSTIRAHEGEHLPKVLHGQGAKSYASHWQADLPPEALTEAGIVDISSLMQPISLEGVDIDSQLVPVIPDDEYESRKLVGQWGERFVYAFLKETRELPDGRKILEVRWINDQTESGNPYDLVVAVEDEMVYVEVKSTASADKELVALSWKELKFAEEKTESFYLFRVYNAGRVSPQLRWLKDLRSYLENKPVRMFLEL